MTFKLRVLTCSLVMVAAACGGKSGGADGPAPGSKRVQLNVDKSRTTPLTTGEHEDTAKTAKGLGCEVKLVKIGENEKIDWMGCSFEGANYKIIFDKPGDEANQTIWCEAAEASVSTCEQLAFDKIFDPKPVTAPTAPDSAPAS